MKESYNEMTLPKIDTELVRDEIIKFIRTEIERSPYNKCIMGLSGGLDSTVVAYLTCEAVRKENLIGLLMPHKTSTRDVVEDAKFIAKNLGIHIEELDISPQIDAFKENHPDDDPRRLGSKMVRERSALLYYYAGIYKAVVLGTANKSEIYLGYFTKWGDPAADILPLTELYKTHVRQLAYELELPTNVIEKHPSAGMWPGQTDEDEIGISYIDADPILYHLIDLKYTPEKLIKKGYDPDLIKKVVKRISDSEFKRKPQRKTKLPKTIFKK